MDVDARISAIADDVEPHRDEYRSIEPYDLAELLGAKAHSHLTVIGTGHYVARPSIEELFYWGDGV
jgi:hypothetical protein